MRPVRQGQSAFLPGETCCQAVDDGNPCCEAGLREQESAEVIVPAEKPKGGEGPNVTWRDRFGEFGRSCRRQPRPHDGTYWWEGDGEAVRDHRRAEHDRGTNRRRDLRGE